ncbi:MAG: CHASE domain-containing protein [Polyangiaceae bacterium]|nr:CHASE domain-containing protein [Polyangiaceae bacterium]MCW5790045.1 CHASE domain-containing protein [Polyangiaceae bacterium]
MSPPRPADRRVSLDRTGIARMARRIGLDGASWVVLVGLGLTSALYYWAGIQDEERELDAFRHHTRLHGISLQRRLDRSLELMQTVPAAFSVKPDLTEAEFVRFVRLAKIANAAVQWAPRVTEEERARFEAAAKASGHPSYQIREARGAGLFVPAAVRATYLPVRYCEPPNKEIVGFDLWSEDSRRAAIEQSRDQGKTLVTGRFELIESQRPVTAIAVYQPVYAVGQPQSSESQRREAFRGVVSSVWVPAQLVREGLAEVDLEHLDVSLTDRSATSEDERVLYESALGASIGVDVAPISARMPIRVGDRQWQVAFAPRPSFARLSPSYRFHLALGGFGVTLVVALAFAVWRGRRVIQRATHALDQLGQYEILEEIGRGGMGVVYKARHATLRRATAVKLLSLPSERLQERFEREALVTSRLRHPNTVAVYDYGRTPDGSLYYAMELISGISLSALVRRYGPLPPARAVHLLKQIAGSLGEAHAAGLVHRDIKPGNVMLQNKGGEPDFVTVLDFGLVRDLTGKVTLSGRDAPVGTPEYMAPEQIRDDIVTPQADLYALGALAYYLLTGTPPFHAPTAVEVCMGHLNHTPEPPSKRLGQPLPEALEQLVLSLLAKDPNHRPGSAREVVSLLEQLPGVPVWSRAEAERWWQAQSQAHVGEAPLGALDDAQVPDTWVDGPDDDRVEGESTSDGERRTITVDFSSRG